MVKENTEIPADRQADDHSAVVFDGFDTVTEPPAGWNGPGEPSGVQTPEDEPDRAADTPVDDTPIESAVLADESSSEVVASEEPMVTEPDVAERETGGARAADDASAASPETSAETEVAAEGAPAVEEAGSETPVPEASAPVISESFVSEPFVSAPTTMLLFRAPDIKPLPPEDIDDEDDDREQSSVRRRARRRAGDENRNANNDPANTVVRVRQPREPELITEPQRIKGSTRLEAKKQRRRDGRDAGRRRPVVTEAEFLARRESVDRQMVVRSKNGRIQIGVLEDKVLVEHYVARNQDASLIGNVYLGRVQNVLPSMEAAFVDIGRGRNAVLYSGEVDWEAAETGNQPRRIELALKPGDKVLVQVTKDPVGHKGARLTSQVSLPGRYLVYVPNGSMNGISRKLPDTERARLKKILKEVLPEDVGVIVRTAAEGATEEQLTLDVNRLTAQWGEISRQVESVQAPALLHSEPDLLIKIVRDVFNEDFQKMIIQGSEAKQTIEAYLRQVAPDLLERIETFEGTNDTFDEFRITEQIEKALDRKVWLPSGGSLVIDRTEAMTVVDVNTGKFVGSGGNLEETVTKNNLEAAEEIVRQLRLRDIGGIIVVDFIDMVLETNRDLVLRRLVECLSRDRTKHQVAEVTSLGLVQMTRKKLGLGLLETFSEPCEVCAGRGVVVHHDPVVKHRPAAQQERRRGGRGSAQSNGAPNGAKATTHAITDDAKNALAQIAASTIVAHNEADEAGDDRATQAAVTDGSGQPEASAQPSRKQRGGRKRRASSSDEDVQRPQVAEPVEPIVRADTPEVAPMAILDIPIAPARTQQRADSRAAEDLLSSVLDALPEPKKPGTGRNRSRRVTTAALTGTPVVHDPQSGQQQGE